MGFWINYIGLISSLPSFNVFALLSMLPVTWVHCGGNSCCSTCHDATPLRVL